MGKIIDLTGQVFGDWTVIEQGESKGDQSRWVCRCKCGEQNVVFSGNLRTGRSHMCSKCARSKRLDDLTGRVFSDWTVINRGEDTNNGLTQWLCLCKCGERKLVPSGRLKARGSLRCKKCAARDSTQGDGPILKARWALGMTLKEFARHTGLSVTGIHKAEREKRGFSHLTTGPRASMKFNKSVPLGFRQDRFQYKPVGRDGQMNRVVITQCAYCRKIVEQLSNDAVRHKYAACNSKCSALFRHHGPKPIETTPELSAQALAQFEPNIRDTKQTDKWVGMKKVLTRAMESD